MLGLILLYFIGQKFYELARDFNQNKWVYAILSIVVYYGAGFLLVISIAILDIYIFEWNFDWESTFGMNLLVIPFGLLGVWVFYTILKTRWEKSIIVVKDEIQDIGISFDEFDNK